MVKLTNVGKAFAVGAVLSLSLLVPARLASAASAPNFVPNTKTCLPNNVNESRDGGTFSVTWDNGSTFVITVTQAPTSPITLYASSYHLTNPAYNGGCFTHDPTAGTFPQTYDNNTQTITLPAGQTGSQTVNVALPSDACYNEQVDLYFGGEDGGPLNGTVGQDGHRDYGFIAGGIMLTSKNPACVGGKGAGPSTPVTPTTPVTPAATPELTNTGLNLRFTSVIATALLAAAAYVFTRRGSVEE